jgi:hypothetical protein
VPIGHEVKVEDLHGPGFLARGTFACLCLSLTPQCRPDNRVIGLSRVDLRIVASVPIPKFANLAAPSDANFGIKGTLANK